MKSEEKRGQKIYIYIQKKKTHSHSLRGKKVMYVMYSLLTIFTGINAGKNS